MGQACAPAPPSQFDMDTTTIPKLTGFANQQKKPHATRQVEQQGNSIARVSQQVNNGEKRAVHFGLEPTSAHSVRLEQRMGRRVVVSGGAADKGRGEAPGDADEGEADDVVERPWLGRGGRVCSV